MSWHFGIECQFWSFNFGSDIFSRFLENVASMHVSITDLFRSVFYTSDYWFHQAINIHVHYFCVKMSCKRQQTAMQNMFYFYEAENITVFILWSSSLTDFCAPWKLFHFYWRYTATTCTVSCWTGKSSQTVHVTVFKMFFAFTLYAATSV